MGRANISIQFRGLDNALQAFVNRDVDCWSIWQDRQMLDKNKGPETLRAFLELLHSSNSTAVYTVKVYEDIEDPKKIKSTTPDDGSYNFRLNEPDNSGYMPYRDNSMTYRQRNSLEERFDQLEERISGFIESHTGESENEDDEENSLQGALIGLLKDPDKLGKFIDVTKNLLGQGAPAYVGNVNRLSVANSINKQNSNASLSPSSNGAAGASGNTDDDKLLRLGKAIDTLEKSDPLLVEHLEKLAEMASEKPTQFSQLISMIDVF